MCREFASGRPDSAQRFIVLFLVGGLKSFEVRVVWSAASRLQTVKLEEKTWYEKVLIVCESAGFFQQQLFTQTLVVQLDFAPDVFARLYQRMQIVYNVYKETVSHVNKTLKIDNS